jgi:hypothetical protein
MATVYIETTVPSYYFETRRSPQVVAWKAATRTWWDRYRSVYDLSLSRLVLAELAAAPSSKARPALSLVEGLTVLDEPQELSAVAEFYMLHRAMPVEARGDAYHLAMASIHRVDFLLTWNCRHLANANKIRHLTILNGRLGLPIPIITTPLTLLPEDAE